MNATDLQNATAEDILAWTDRRFGPSAPWSSLVAHQDGIGKKVGARPAPELRDSPRGIGRPKGTRRLGGSDGT